MTRDYGRAPRGQRVLGSVPRNRGEVTTMIGALGLKGIRGMMTVEGGTDADVFEAFVEQFLVRKLLPGDIVVLDNVGRTSRPAFARWSRPLEPDCSTCRPTRRTSIPSSSAGASSSMLKDVGARTRDALDAAIRRAIDLIGADDARAWFTLWLATSWCCTAVCQRRSADPPGSSGGDPRLPPGMDEVLAMRVQNWTLVPSAQVRGSAQSPAFARRTSDGLRVDFMRVSSILACTREPRGAPLCASEALHPSAFLGIGCNYPRPAIHYRYGHESEVHSRALMSTAVHSKPAAPQPVGSASGARRLRCARSRGPPPCPSKRPNSAMVSPICVSA